MHDPYQYFKIEAAELVEEMTKGLLQLEKSVDDVDLVKTLFRYAHTLKGAASVVRLGVISDLAHRVEDWLAVFRDKGLRAGGEDITLLLEAVDVISLLIDAVSEGKAEDSINVGPILQKLEKGEQAVRASGTDAPDSPPSTHDGDSLADQGDQQAIVTQTDDRSEAQDEGEGASRQRARTQPQETGERKIAETLRIDTDDMQLMTDFANEIVINILHLKQLVSSFREGEKSREQDHESLDIFCDQLEQALEQTGRFSQEMSDLIMDMRLVSVGEGAFFFEKTVRDLAHFLDKDIEFILEGEANEVDRSLLAGVKEPIYHLLRNSIIHGVESVDERLTAGKTRQARIRLEFKKNGEWLEITCQDDGRGLDAQKIKEHVIQNNMMDEDAAEALSHQEVLHLIFESGFSMAETVTELAGRGVGLDFVNNTVKLLGGTISVDSAKGQYTHLLLRLPLSVNVVDAFLVEVGGHKLLLPMQHIVETRLVKEAQIKTEAGRGTLRFYDQAVLLVNLEEAMKLGTPSRNPVFPVLFIRSHEETLALQVDAILGRRKILLKPLPDPLQTLAFISGVTIAENGMPAFVVSVADIFARLKHRAVQSLSQGEASLPASVLVIDDSLTTRTLINGILLDEGYRVSLAQSAEDAATMIEEQNFDLIITDVEMPGEDGFALTERIRSHPKHSETPVMIMSSRGSDADIRQGIAVGASAYIVKGQFEQKVFIETLESLI